MESACAQKTFVSDYTYLGYQPEIKKAMLDMAMNGRGIRETARALSISPGTVISEIKKQECFFDVQANRRLSRKRSFM